MALRYLVRKRSAFSPYDRQRVPRNVVLDLAHAQMSAFSYRTLLNCPYNYVVEHDRMFDCCDVPVRLFKIAALLRSRRRYGESSLANMNQHLMRIFNAVSVLEGSDSADEHESLARQERFATLIYVYGGINILSDILLMDCDRENFEPSSLMIDVKALTVEILIKLQSADASLRDRLHPIGSRQQQNRSGATSEAKLEHLVWEFIGKELSNNSTLFHSLFSLLKYKETTFGVCQIIEDMLMYRGNVNLFDIAELPALIEETCLDDEQLSAFAGVLAGTMTSSDMTESKVSLTEQNRRRRSETYKNTKELNQDFLNDGVPKLMERLVKIITHDDGIPRFPNIVGEIDNWIAFIEPHVRDTQTAAPQLEDRLSLSNLTGRSPPAPQANSMLLATIVSPATLGRPGQQSHDSSRGSSVQPQTEDEIINRFVSMLSTSVNTGESILVQASRRVAIMLINKVNILLLLSYCFGGKKKREVQEKAARLGLFRALYVMFAKFIWRAPPRAVRETPETAMKIQFLRLMHQACDQFDLKDHLFSKSELRTIVSLNEGAPARLRDPHVQTFDSSHCCCDDGDGLLTRIIQVVLVEQSRSAYRFWLTRALESFLRCDRSWPYQTFMVNKGLVAHLLRVLVDENHPNSEVLQSTFDLLSELVKFNMVAFVEIDKFFDANGIDLAEEKSAKYKLFFDRIEGYPVDSNMFVRSLVLSYEDLVAEKRICSSLLEPEPDSTEATAPLITTIPGGKILAHVDAILQRLIYSRLFLDQVYPVETITQENVSCLNTAIILFMFSRKRGTLHSYLQGMYDEQGVKLSQQIGGCALMKRIWKLLLFWQDYYLHKDKDCTSLERSSRIVFKYWNETVQVMLKPDATLGTTIASFVSLDALVSEDSDMTSIERNS